MGDHNRLHREPVPVYYREDVIDFIARIDDDRFLAALVSKNRAVALQQTHRQYLVNHVWPPSMPLGSKVAQRPQIAQQNVPLARAECVVLADIIDVVD